MFANYSSKLATSVTMIGMTTVLEDSTSTCENNWHDWHDYIVAW